MRAQRRWPCSSTAHQQHTTYVTNRRSYYPARGTPARSRLRTGGPCTILFSSTQRDGAAAWRLGARMPRPGTRGKRRQVAERDLADLPLTRQLRSAGASSTASPQRRRRRPKQTCRLHDGGFGRRVWCADCPQLPSPTTPRLSCPCAPIPSPQTTLTHLPPRHSRRRRRHCPRQHQLTSALQLLRR